MASENDEMEKILCKGPCNKEFPRNSIRKHLARAKACQSSYTDEEHDAFKNSSREINKLKRRVTQKENYNEDARETRSRKHKETYNEDAKERRSKKHKETYGKKAKIERKKTYQKKKEKAKKASTPEQRLLDFRRANQHGPIFTCISCHRDRFKNGVKEVTKKLESKIRDNGMYRYISNLVLF